jgi:para-nitrobenzyl esterase
MSAMPSAAGLFQRAIAQSGPLLRALPLERATATARALLGALDLEPTDLKGLLDVPAKALLDAVSATLPSMISGVTSGQLARGQHGLQLSPVVDGRSLPADPFEPSAAPSAAQVPLILGTTTYESALFAAMAPNFPALDDEGYLGIVRAVAGDLADHVLAVYGRTRPGANAVDLALAAMTAPFWSAAITLAERKEASGAAPVFMYLFAYETDAYDGRLKSGHGVDVPFIFDVVDDLPYTGTWEGRQRLAHAMSDAWIAFARTGNPNHPGVPYWPRYEPRERATMIFDRETAVVNDPMGEERRAWAKAPLRF